MKRICVFCGSQSGNDSRFQEAANELGKLLVDRGLGLVYGGGGIGLMGQIADSVIANGGEVIGIIPDFLSSREIRHDGITTLEVVPDMHTRKARMASLADGFVAMAGGYGTFEELFEIITWSQLRLHAKPIGILNTAGYFDALIQMIDSGIEHGFIQGEAQNLTLTETDPAQLLDNMQERFQAGHSNAPEPDRI